MANQDLSDIVAMRNTQNTPHLLDVVLKTKPVKDVPVHVPVPVVPETNVSKNVIKIQQFLFSLKITPATNPTVDTVTVVDSTDIVISFSSTELAFSEKLKSTVTSVPSTDSRLVRRAKGFANIVCPKLSSPILVQIVPVL